MCNKDLESNEWFQTLRAEVEQELLRLRHDQHDRRPALEAERQQLAAQLRGWSQSLGNPELDAAVRSTIEEDLRRALERKREIEAALSEQQAADHLVSTIVDPQQIKARLDRLADVLALGNPSLGNLELSLHIDRITCDANGQVNLRLCRLGALPEAVELLRPDEPSCDGGDGSMFVADPQRVQPRRRARLRVNETDAAGRDLKALAHWAADPQRFLGLPEHWFEEQVFQLPERKGWAEQHAAEVARQRLAKMTVEKLAEHFGKSIPTIRSALRYAAVLDEFAGRLPGKLRPARWHEEHAGEVAARKAQGQSVPEMARHFRKSETTIRKALEHAATLGLKEPPATSAFGKEQNAADPDAA